MRAIAVVLILALAGCLSGADLESAPEQPTTESNPAYGAGNASASLLAATPTYFATKFNAPEPNMGVTSSGAIFFSAGSNIVRSIDEGATWEIVQTHQLMNSDPMMWVDPWTDCIYNAPMFPILAGATLYRSCDDGDTWTAIHSQNVGRGVYDHQKLASALPGPDAAPIVGVAHPTALIICYNALAYTNCAMSYDGGLTWPIDGPIWDSARGPSCAGQQSHPTGAPDGTIVVAKAWNCAEPLVFISTDSGVTWEMRDGPQGVGADTLDPEIAFTDDGAMYILYQSKRSESRAQLARSDDMGVTWSGPWDVTPPGTNATIFAALGAGTPGRVAMTFHATAEEGEPGQASGDAIWNTYTVISEDADSEDPTFVAYQMNPEGDPIQAGSICKGNRGCSDGNRNLLDFIDGAVGPNGEFYSVIADGCIDSCIDDPEPSKSRSRQGAVMRLDNWSLFAE